MKANAISLEHTGEMIDVEFTNEAGEVFDRAEWPISMRDALEARAKENGLSVQDQFTRCLTEILTEMKLMKEAA